METQPYHGTPYDGRTAGSGVEYVRAHMAPAASLNTEPQIKVEEPAPAAEKPAEPEPAPVATPPPAESGEKVFNKAIQK